MSTFLATRPRLYVVVIRDDSDQIKEVLQLLTSLLWWLWLHKEVVVQLAEDIGRVVDLVVAVREAYLSLFRLILEPVKMPVGAG